MSLVIICHITATYLTTPNISRPAEGFFFRQETPQGKQNKDQGKQENNPAKGFVLNHG
jgi:hypothetical protein